MDLNDVERIELQAFGGSDTIIVDDVSGTDLKQVAIDLGAGDASIDTVYCYGNNANNTVNVATAGGGVSVSGLAAQVTIANSEFTDDLVLQGFAGNDKINASALTAGLIHFNAVGGKGNDTITGSAGEDLLYGGDDNDTVAGGHGDDLVLLGNGNDLFVWNLGDGSDTVEGEAGTDTLRFIGSNTPADLIAMGANGTRSALTFNIGNVSMDLNGIERFEVRALGGEDQNHRRTTSQRAASPTSSWTWPRYPAARPATRRSIA